MVIIFGFYFFDAFDEFTLSSFPFLHQTAPLLELLSYFFKIAFCDGTSSRELPRHSFQQLSSEGSSSRLRHFHKKGCRFEVHL